MLEAYHDATSHAVKSLEEEEEEDDAAAAGGAVVVVGSAASSSCCPISEADTGAEGEEEEEWRLSSGLSAGDWEERAGLPGFGRGLLLMEWPAKVGGRRR